MRAALVIALLLVPTTAHANLVDTIYCRLKPRSEACRPTPVPPIKPTAQPTPKLDPGRPMPRGPVVVRPKPKPKAAKPKRGKPVAKPIPRRRVTVDEGPDLPWPCWMVRIGAAGKTTAQLRAEGKSRGIAASRKQCLQAQACLGRNLSC